MKDQRQRHNTIAVEICRLVQRKSEEYNSPLSVSAQYYKTAW